MPKLSDIFPSKYLSAADLQNKEVIVTIERVEFDQFDNDGGKATKPVAYFHGSQKAMVLNKTNAATIGDIAGQDDTDNWPGARICLYPTMVPFGNKMTEAIRVKRPPEPTAVAVSSPPPAVPPAAASVASVPEPTAAPAVAVSPQVDADLNDEIPWK